MRTDRVFLMSKLSQTPKENPTPPLLVHPYGRTESNPVNYCTATVTPTEFFRRHRPLDSISLPRRAGHTNPFLSLGVQKSPACTHPTWAWPRALCREFLFLSLSRLTFLLSLPLFAQVSLIRLHHEARAGQNPLVRVHVGAQRASKDKCGAADGGRVKGADVAAVGDAFLRYRQVHSPPR